MKQALRAIPKIPRWPRFPDAPKAPKAGFPEMPGVAATKAAGDNAAAGLQVPGDVHRIPGEMIKRIGAAIGRRGKFEVGTDAHIERVMKAFPLDRYRDADGNVRCPVSQEERDRLKSVFGD